MDTDRAVTLAMPFEGRWLVQNSPARRVPSHGTRLYGLDYAIDFVAVDDAGRSAKRTIRSWFALEDPEGFVGFGAPILAPVSGTIAAVHDRVPDHRARRAPTALVAYALSQSQRVAAGLPAIAGNHVIIALSPTGPYVGLAHLRAGSILVSPGDEVVVGQRLGRCGNSGNSTEPHVHVQVTDSIPYRGSRGLPIRFRGYAIAGVAGDHDGMPAEDAIITAGPSVA